MRMLIGYIGFAFALAAALIVARSLSWVRLSFIAVAFLLAFLNGLYGCTTISHASRIEGWPQLEERLH